MACSKWEEAGLLYTSNELDELETKSFEAHLNLCGECKKEYNSYQKERSTYFTAEFLGESPSQKTDAEILRVCSSARPKHFTSSFFPLFLKKTAYSVTFFVLGFIVVGYFTMVIENPGRNNKKIALEKRLDSLSQPSSMIADGIDQNNDSLQFDSLNDTNNYFSKSRGNLEVNGVYPVDLNDK